jgi:hypothetical protein
MPNANDTPDDDAPPRRDPFGGDLVGGDKLTAGHIAHSTMAIGAGASASVSTHHHYYVPVASSRKLACKRISVTS